MWVAPRLSTVLIASVLTSALWAAQLPPDASTASQPGEVRAETADALRLEEHQRILGVLPNFNSTQESEASRLTPKQKWDLAVKTAIDPVTMAVAMIDGAWSQEQNSFPGYGQGLSGYSKRFGASYADSVSSTLLGNALLPILFKQDPRYLRKGSGHISSRVLYAISTTVRAKNDGGRWIPNYSNVLGNFAAGGLSNLYYPASDRGAVLTMQRAFTVTAEGALGALFVEFWPDIAVHLKKKHSNLASN